MSEAIATKCRKLSRVLNEDGGPDCSWRSCREALLDGFLVLFDECGTEAMQKDKHIAAFVKKYKENVKVLRNTRPSISDFKIISTIGRGHFGQVQVVKENQSNNVYALKTLKKSEMLSQENVAFFEEERDIMAYGKSRWITSLHYAFQDAQNLYLVMEFHPGGDLLTLLGKQENEVLEEKVAKFYVAEIVLALHSLHELGYVHRDVKPDNILIDKHGHIKLADFGSAAKLGENKKVHSKMAVGTPEYISPEVLTSMEGHGSGYGVECDWWSLGVIAYEMIFGNPPFTGPSVAVTYNKIMNFKESLTFPSEIQGSLSFKSLIKGLLTDIQARFSYNDLINHKFFQGVSWSTLERDDPPYIPIITGVDDTSNFDEFDDEEEKPSFGNIATPAKKGFCGKDLPFVGFSFMKSDQITMNCGSSDVLSENMGTNQNGLDHGNERNDNERVTLKKMIDELQELLNKRKDTIECLENKKDLLEKEKLLKETEIKDLKKRLDVERAERNNDDNKAVKLISEVDTMRKKARELRKEETRAVLDEQQDVLTQLEEDRFVALKRSQRLEDELERQQKMVEERNITLAELQKTIDELKEQLKTAKKVDSNVAEAFARLRHVQEESIQCSPVPQIRELQKVRRQSSPLASSAVCSQRVEEISNRIMEAIEKCQEKERNDVKKMRERLKKKMDECSELESQLVHSNSVKRKLQKAEEKVAEVEKENEALCHAIKKLEKEVDDSNGVSRQRKRDLDDQEKKMKQNESVVLKLKEELCAVKQESESIFNKNKDLEGEIVKLKESCTNFENALETVKQELNEKNRCIEELEWTAKYTAKQSIDGENINHFKSQLELKNVELKELESKNKKLQENIDNLARKSEEYASTRQELEQRLSEKECLVENLLKNEEAMKTAQNNGDTEATDNKVKVKSLETEVITLTKKNDDINGENKELNEQVEKLIEKCECLMKSKEELENELNNKMKLIEEQSEKRKAVQPSKEDMLKESLKSNSEEIQDLKAEIVVINNENVELKTKNRELQSGMRNINNEMTEIKNKSEAFEAEMKTKLKNVEDLQKTITMLKTTCSMLEGQIEELEILNDELDERNIQLEIETKHLLLSNEKYEQARQEELSRERGNTDNEEVSKEKALIQEYSETIATQQNQLNVSELNLKSLERKMEKEMAAKKKMQTEIEQQKTAIESHEGQYCELKQAFEEMKERHAVVLNEHTAMTEHLGTLKTLHAEEKVKLVSTSAQQTKLIDFLQSKAESKAKKKFLGVSNLINSWKHQDENNFIPCQWSELQQSLEKERTTRIHLQNELNKVKEELEESKGTIRRGRHMTPSSGVPRSNQSLAVLNALQQSPSRQPSPGTTLTPTIGSKRKTSRNDTGSHRPKERMRHNIPHRLTVMLNMRATKCPVCLDSILFGRQVTRCTECGVVCHCKCSLSLQHTCGLPTQYVEHFSETLREPRSETSLLSTPGDDAASDGKMEHFQGWLKVPRNGSAKNGWEPRWVVLDDGKLKISEQEKEQDDDCDVLVLSGDDSDVKIHSAVAGSDLHGVAATDLPYVFSLEATPKTTCWPGRTVFLLAPSFPEKQRWVRLLERVVSDNKDTRNAQGQKKINGNLLLKMKGDECLDTNCTAVLNDKFVIVGAEEGLFILPVAKSGKGNSVRQVPGVRNVFQIELVQELGIALVISGVDRDLMCIEIKQLEACTKQSREVPLAQLEFKNIENITNCHLFASKKVDEGFFLCAALPNKISVLRFNSSMNSFVVRKEIDSSEPCSCILFSKSKVIVGSNKFYQIDLRHFTIKDFLDSKDTSLAFAIYHASQANTFPIDILQVSPENASKEEFLLCFNGFGVFVNSNGKRTRKDDLKWTGLPLSFAYQEPYLFVTHFHSIEICQLPALNQENQEPISHKFVEITRPRILGGAMSPGAIYLVSTLPDEIQMLCYQGNLMPVLSNIDQNNSSSSDSENVRQGRKRQHPSTGTENNPPVRGEPNSLSAFSRNPKKFLRSSLRH